MSKPVIKLQYCVAGLPEFADSYAFVNECQEYDVLLEIQHDLGVQGLKQAVFDTRSGERKPLFISWSREMGKRFYRVKSVNGNPLKDYWE